MAWLVIEATAASIASFAAALCPEAAFSGFSEAAGASLGGASVGTGVGAQASVQASGTRGRSRGEDRP